MGLEGGRAHDVGGLGGGSRPHHADPPGQAADAVGDGGRAQAVLGAAAGDRRRRGRSLSRRQPIHQTHGSDRRASGGAACGPHHRQRETGDRERSARRALLRRGGGPLARAQIGLSRTHEGKSHEETDMDLKLEGKTALVTGGSAGIGKGIARALAQEGVDVAICARRKEPLEEAAAEIARATNRRIVPIPADLSKDADAKNFVAQGHEALGRPDSLVKNAGSSPGGVLEHLSEADWEQSLQLKFMAYLPSLPYSLPTM